MAFRPNVRGIALARHRLQVLDADNRVMTSKLRLAAEERKLLPNRSLIQAIEDDIREQKLGLKVAKYVLAAVEKYKGV